MFAMNFVVAFVLLVAVALATKDVRRGGNPTKEQMKEFRSKVEKIQRGASNKRAVESTIVGAQLRCHGYLCPQWALDVSRWDMEPLCDECSQETQLIELLPLAPTFQRKPRIFTDYDEPSRAYTIAVQSYPGPGVDTFFVVELASDISSAKILQNRLQSTPKLLS